MKKLLTLLFFIPLFVDAQWMYIVNGNGDSIKVRVGRMEGVPLNRNDITAVLVGAIGIPVYTRVTGSNFTTTGQTLVNITGLSVALTTNAVYEFEARLSGSTTAVTTGTAYGINYSAAGATIESGVVGSFTTAATKSERVSALNTATTAFLTTSAQTGQIRIKGIITTGANAGSLTVSTLKITSGTSTIFINSYLSVIRIL